MKRFSKVLTPVLLALMLFACSGEDTSAPLGSRGVYMLLDTSGTYTEELDKARQIISFLLTEMNPGDTFAIARIDTASFSEKDIVAKVKFDDRPSATNQQKRVFLDEVDTFIRTVSSSSYTDISGGMLQAQEYLMEHNVRERVILVFSDMQEDLPEGYVRDISFQLEDFQVIALNVTKLREDNMDPRVYMDRLDDWRNKVEEGGGMWTVINDLDRIEEVLQ